MPSGVGKQRKNVGKLLSSSSRRILSAPPSMPSFERRVRDFRAAEGLPSVECRTRRQNKFKFPPLSDRHVPTSLGGRGGGRWQLLARRTDNNRRGTIRSHNNNRNFGAHTQVPRAHARRTARTPSTQTPSFRRWCCFFYCLTIISGERCNCEVAVGIRK